MLAVVQYKVMTLGYIIRDYHQSLDCRNVDGDTKCLREHIIFSAGSVFSALSYVNPLVEHAHTLNTIIAHVINALVR